MKKKSISQNLKKTYANVFSPFEGVRLPGGMPIAQAHKAFRHVYVSVNLCNQAIRELTENFRQFVNILKILGNLLQNTEAWPILVCR